MTKMQSGFAGQMLVKFGFLFVLIIIDCRSVAAQSNLKEQFPEAFVFPNPNHYLNLEPVSDVLELSFEQREIVKEIHKRHWDEYDAIYRDYQPPDLNSELIAHAQRSYAEYSGILLDQQAERLNQLMVTRFFQAEAERNASLEKSSVRNDFAGLLLVPSVITFLKIEDHQQLEIKDAIESVTESTTKTKESYKQSLDDIFERWQRTLLAELLDFQRRDFENAIGKTFEFPDMIQQMQIKSNFGGPQFLQVDFDTVSRYKTSPPSEITMLLQTPFYLDAHMQPDGMFALLLSEESIKELKITPDQYERLNKLKASWSQMNPLPTELIVELKFGNNMSSKKQREESTAANKAYQAIENQVFEVVTTQQRERFRQIWNQLVLSMGWSEVALTFPDWRDYLELSNEQVIAFDRIHAEFRAEIKKLAVKIAADKEGFVRAFRESVTETLNDEQKDQLRRVFGVALDSDPNGRR